MFENPWRGRQAGKKYYKKCSENSRSQIVFRTDIFRQYLLLRTDILQKTVVGFPCALTFFLSIILESLNTRITDDRSCLSIISILNPSENFQYSKETDLNWTETPEVLNALPRDLKASCDKKLIWGILREKKKHFVLIIFINLILFQYLDSHGIKTSKLTPQV